MKHESPKEAIVEVVALIAFLVAAAIAITTGNALPLLLVLGVLGLAAIYLLIALRAQIRNSQRRLEERLTTLHEKQRTERKAERRALAKVSEGAQDAARRAHKSAAESSARVRVVSERLDAWIGTAQRADHARSVQIRATGQKVVNETIAALQVHQASGDALAPLPPFGGWALDATSLVKLLHLLRTERPALVVECGSGSSTVVIAQTIREWGGRVIALDHLEEFASASAALITSAGLDEVADVRHAPLTEVEVEGQTLSWYDPAQVEDLHDIELLVVDGPPAATGPDARYPALPILADRLTSSVTVVVDDIEREAERRAVSRWQERWPQLQRSSANSTDSTWVLKATS